MLQPIQAQVSTEQEEVEEEVVKARQDPTVTDNAVSPHTEMQYYLAYLGRSLGFDVWIPKPDQGREFDERKLKELSLGELPPLPFSESVLKIIRHIDVIWLQEEHPIHIFEVEHTTSVYSGILRMSDLVSLIPSLNIMMYICSNSDRIDKVRAEINRPTFSKRPNPLVNRCRFIPFESLTEFISESGTYLRHLNVSILDEISESLLQTNITN